jgi:1,4-dihydroxy-2-naphthoate octaprenyltransferase
MTAIASWLDALRTTNLPEERAADPVTRWLLLARASVLPMTFFSAAFGGLLAIPSGTASLGLWALCTLGLLLAHVANNLANDYFDYRSGVDTPDYARALYGPHPILDGLLSERGLLRAVLVVNALDAAVMGVLVWARGWAVLAFALAGFALSLFYVAPPLRLKHHGLGEPSIFVVWGPLMVGGTYFVTTGALPGWVWLASLPYGLLVTAVLFGKHIDKLESDRAKGIRTLPVLLGERRARRAALGLIFGFYALVAGLVATGVLGVFALLAFASLPRLARIRRIFREPRPSSAPEGYPAWPLWYVAAAFLLTRQAGALLALGLALNAAVPIYL